MSTKKLSRAFVLLASLATPSSAFFKLACKAPVVVQRADPLMSPGKVSAHVHTIMGGNGFGFEMNYDSARASTCSSCTIVQDMSNYWVPTLYFKAKNGSLTSVDQAGGMTVYYLQRSDTKDPGFADGLLAFPPGFAMLAGNAMVRSYSETLEQRAISYACLGTSTKETHGFPNIKCPGGLRAQIFFPSCWDGIIFEPKDQHLHLAYPTGVNSGHCLPPFNKRLISIFYEVIWNTKDFDDEWHGNSQPFVLSNGDPTGYGYHGDFVNGWDVPTLQNAVNECDDPNGEAEKCKFFNFVSPEQAVACKVPTSVHEQVFGTMDSLPGCNTIQTGPHMAISQDNKCGATTVISSPRLPFSDMTVSKGFSYLGCGPDLAGQPRTLLGADLTDTSGMTIEKCIDYCQSKGFSIAGLEFAKQCFCDNTIPDRRLPDPLRIGNCNMPCPGNTQQICGGAGLISLYKKCGAAAAGGGRGGAGKCTNAPMPFINGSAGNNSSVRPPAATKPISVSTLISAGSVAGTDHGVS